MAELQFDPKSPIIAVFAKIYGEQTRRIRLALDTGATFVMIPWEIADILGYSPHDSPRKTRIITASGIQHVPVVTLKTVSVIGMKAENVDAVVHNLPEESYVNGLLGLSFLRNFKICLNFGKGTLNIEK